MQTPSDLRLLSVPHTGTRFTRELLLTAGYEPSVNLFQQHFTGENNHWIIYELECPAIISTRKKDEVIKSWERRNRKDPEFNGCWAEMERFIADNDCYLLRVDDPDHRDSDLKAIEELIGKPLFADFDQKIGHGI